MTDTLFPLSERNEERRPGRGKRQKKLKLPRQKRISYQTWTRAELLLADWLLAWALARIRAGWQVDAYIELRKRVRAAIDAKDREIIERFLQCKPPLPHDAGARWEKLWRLFQRTLQQSPF